MTGTTIPVDDPVQTEAVVRPRASSSIPPEQPTIVDAAPTTAPGRRRWALAGAIVEILRKAIVNPAATEIVLAGAGPDVVASGERPRTRLVIHDPDALARLLLPPSGDAFAEAFLRGELEIEGDVMAAILAAESLDWRRLGRDDIRRLVRWTVELRRGTAVTRPLRRISGMTGGLHSRARDMAAIRFHYDVGNAFYALWLDARMTYSCAYFPEGATAATAAGLLDGAQEAKLDLIARKLRLEPGMRLLDIGSGWGSLINFAAERYGSQAVGVTLSERQADESNTRAASAGLADRAIARVVDYRDMASLGTFDAVASVGMFEHVGRANLSTYFGAAFDSLRPGGLFLNHGIAGSGSRAGLRPRLRPRARHFIERYVFPDGELVPIEDAIAVARRAGFEIVDVQSLRAHYALTLAAWVARLEANWAAAVAATGEEVARTWRLYMSAARLGFERADLDVCQLLLSKPADGRPAEMPLRPWW